MVSTVWFRKIVCELFSSACFHCDFVVLKFNRKKASAIIFYDVAKKKHFICQLKAYFCYNKKIKDFFFKKKQLRFELCQSHFC